MTDFKQLANFALEQRASDIHLVSNMQPMVRVDGTIREVRIEIMTPEMIMNILSSIMNKEQMDFFSEGNEIDFSLAVDSGTRFRVNAFTAINGPSVVFRLIPNKIPSLVELETPQVIQTLTSLPKGLVLVTGPTGSGKSTTLAAMVDYINQHYEKHIITIEDPIEFIHTSKKSLVNQREVGTHTKSFQIALRNVVREDPNVILVGELRDLESIRLAMTAAETGSLVLATLHTNTAAQTINRIIDVFPGDEKQMIRSMLASSLEAVVAQRLVRKSSGQGRVALYEVMIATSAIKNLIKEDKVPQIHSVIQVGSTDGMISMKDYADQLVQRGIISQNAIDSVLRTSQSMTKEAQSTKINYGSINKGKSEDEEDF